MFINRKSNVSYLKCVAFFSFIRLNNSHISSKVTDCKDVITQISASKSSLQRLMGIIISENLIECVKAAADDEESSQELINEAVNLLVKSK